MIGIAEIGHTIRLSPCIIIRILPRERPVAPPRSAGPRPRARCVRRRHAMVSIDAPMVAEAGALPASFLAHCRAKTLWRPTMFHYGDIDSRSRRAPPALGLHIDICHARGTRRRDARGSPSFKHFSRQTRDSLVVAIAYAAF